MMSILVLPTSIFSGILTYRFYNRTEIKQILDQFEQMHKVLKVITFKL
jgi:hypothetical protein